MSNAYRMRWRPAMGVLAIGVLAIGFGIQGASAEKARTTPREKSKGSPQAAAVSAARPVSNAQAAVPKAAAATQNTEGYRKSQLPQGAVAVPTVVEGLPMPTTWQAADVDDLPGFAGEEAAFGEGATFGNSDSLGTVATGTTGACCISPCGCVANQTAAQCTALSGTYLGDKTVCANDACGCLTRACCNPAGSCIGDTTRECCETGDDPPGTDCAPPFNTGGNTWNIDASCSGAGGLPLPTCNAYNVNNCSWDNGQPLNDGGTNRAHVHSGGVGQLPRYDFSTADDFILRGPDSTPCVVSSVRWWFNARPSDTTGPVFIPADPPNDFVGMTVTVFENYVPVVTGINAPAGHGLVPATADDFNPKVADAPGGVVYARTFFNNEGFITYTNLTGTFCDPPPAVGTEAGYVWQADIAIDPPIYLNKNVKYWLDVQGLFPFNDGLRETLQSWWMHSTTNTGFRAMSHRTGNPAYVVSGVDVWAPHGQTALGAAGGPELGNQGAAAPCAAVAANTRFDVPFLLNGGKDPAGIPNDLCANVFSGPQNAFDGYNPFSNAGAGTDGPGSCAANQDIWFRYTATCDGVLTVETCDSDFNSIVAIYDNLGCPAGGEELDCDSASCGAGNDDGRAVAVVADTADLLIRVGGDGAASGKGVLRIFCESTCGADDGDPLVNNCCIDHSANSPPDNLGCENALCCQIVCSTPGEEVCCNNFAIGWDSECASVAEEIPACQCPCAFSCPVGSQIEAEACGGNTNGGCNSDPEAFEDLGTLVLGTPKSLCGTVQAAGGTRDTDWYTVTVPSTASGFATLNIVMNGSAPISVLVFSRFEAPDTGAGETFCLDKACTGATTCQAASACTEDDDCPVGQTCEEVGATLLLFDAIATASCQPTDGLGDNCQPLITCVPHNATYVLVALTAAADGDCNAGDGIFNGVTCGAQDDYSMRITATNDCQDGACCLFNGSCEDGSPGTARNGYECFLAGGSFAGEGETCEALPPDVDCVELAHGCAAATTITCGQTINVDLTTDDHFPEEPYPCGAAGNDPNDRAWLKFVAPCVDDDGNPGANDCNDETGTDVTSVRLNTCNSANPGRDSLLSIYGSCCPLSGICPGTGAGCDEGTFCGGACSADTPFATSGCSDDVCGFTDFLSDICDQNLIEGETYYIQVSNWAEPVNGVYALSLTCPCTGSCCDASTATCNDNIPADNCQTPLQFDTQMTCSQLTPPCGQGACCNPNGTCSDVVATSCPPGSNHFAGAVCSSIVCNLDNSCDFNTGDPTDPLDQANFGFRSQYAQDIELFIEIADQFEMKGSTGNDCEIASITWTTFHTSHDTVNGCLQGGGTGCADSASEYDGLIITISEDSAGDEKGPTCPPVCTTSSCSAGADGDYHNDDSTPGCQSYAFGPALGEGDPIPSGNYWEFIAHTEGGQTEFWITAHFQPPISLEKNKKNWLAVTHIVNEVSRYSVIWFSSNNYNANPSQAFSTAGDLMFNPLATPNDQLFAIEGAKVAPGCGECRLHGDVAELPSVACLIDVDDLLCELDGFANFSLCPRGDILPCAPDPCTVDADCAGLSNTGDVCIAGGCRCASDADCQLNPGGSNGCNETRQGGRCELLDVDDLLSVLDAFSGISACPSPCPPGACVGDYLDDLQGPGVTCRDGDSLGAFFVGNGMSESDCFNLVAGGGNYCGDNTVCDPDQTCPGAP